MLDTMQDAAKSAAESLPVIGPFVQYGIVGIALGVLAFVVHVLRDTGKENIAMVAQLSKEHADRLAMQSKESAERNQKTVDTVQGIAREFGETTTLSAKALADAVREMQTQQSQQAREQREEHSRREAALVQALQQANQRRE